MRWCGSLTHVKHVKVTQLLLSIPATEHVQVAICHQSCQRTERKGEEQTEGGGGVHQPHEGDTSTTWNPGIVVGCVDPQSHTRKRQPTAQSSCNSCVINREQAEGAVGMALITRTQSAPAKIPSAKSQRREVIGHGPVL